MSDPNSSNLPTPSPGKSSGEQAHASLVARLARLDSTSIPVRPPQSMQPTPEATRTRVSRLRKKRLLIQPTKRAHHSPPTIPHVRDPLAP